MSSAASTLDLAVTGVRDQLATLAEALVRGDIGALEAAGSRWAEHLRALQQASGQTVELSTAAAEAAIDARWELERCRRLGVTPASLPHAAAAEAPTYLPTGEATRPSAAHSRLEVKA